MAFLFGFPLLIIASLGILIFAENGKARLIGVAILWGSAFAIGCLGMILDYYREPIKLAPEDLFGTYKVDTTFYPGTNAHWQYNHYKFTITHDSIKLYTVNFFGKETAQSYPILFSSENASKWKINREVSGPVHHILQRPPTLYRSHRRFYYVLESPLYGNMFFRKAE